MNTAPRLACQQCKQRKLRCDKGSPCNACRTAGFTCQVVQRARLPRGKSGGNRIQKQSLETRLKQLEALLDQHTKASTNESTCIERSKLQPDSTQFLAQDFWSSLSGTISGVREILEASDDEFENHFVDRPRSQGLTGEIAQTKTPLLFPAVHCQAFQPPTPSPAFSALLFDLFRDRVDTVYKVVHLPTTLTSIKAAYTEGKMTVPLLALEYAMYFMALCTVEDDEAQAMGLGPRLDLLGAYRTATEHFLASSNLLSCPNLSVLQALTIYMIGLRTCLNSATTWTLVAVAARIVTALRLGDEDPCKYQAAELDARRRALYAVGVLDTHAALDRGTIPLLPASAFRIPPLNIDDDDTCLEDGAGISFGPRITDMTHSLMTYQAMLCQRKMYDLSKHGLSSWSERLQLVLDFGARAEELEQQIGSSSVPMHMLIVASGRKIHRSLELLLRRPPYRQSTESVPSWDSFDSMQAATVVLELHLEEITPELKPWAWKNWVQWHALAVLLAELLMRPNDPFAHRAFQTASDAFYHYARIVADSQSGLLWKPIARLMHRVQDMRQKAARPGHAQDTARPVVEMIPDNSVMENCHLHNPSFFELSSGNFDGQAADPVNYEVDSLSLERNQRPWLVWDEFLEEIIDTSAWSY